MDDARPREEFLAYGESADLQSVTDVVHQRLRSAIMSGAIGPGEHLRQEDVASRFGISRSPAREALARLAMEGLVEQRPRRGYLVSALNVDEIEELYGMLMLLEGRAGTLAAQRRTAADIVEVEKAFCALDAIHIKTPADIDRFSRANRAFHERMWQCSQSRHLCRTILQLRDQLERYVRFEMSMHDRVRPGDHSKIFKAFKAGDAALTGRLSMAHCEKVCRQLVQRLDGRQRAPSASKNVVAPPQSARTRAGGVAPLPEASVRNEKVR